MIDRMLLLFFRLHDWASAFLAKHFFTVKKGLLLLAHASLFGFFFPELRSEFGEAGGNLLIGILFLSPLSKIFRIRLLQQLMGLRREFGIMFGYLVTVHGIGYLSDPLLGSIAEGTLAANPFLFERAILFGLMAYVLTLPLLLTSNNLANRLLGGKNWKRLHRLVYLLALAAVVHRFMMNDMTNWALIQMVFLITSYILAKLLAWRNFLPPLAKAIAFVSVRYQAYRASLVKGEPTSPSSPQIS